ncbi:MAG: glycosyltransferase family 2 protein [Deltaproteobacteria bacterium]|nr:glycosyltransferase family 2 protein [Deltaproteobacteria bacterium]MBT4526870.1 glycosyltransferase family 2 protein [Deltaproteobacteria bacterium]
MNSVTTETSELDRNILLSVIIPLYNEEESLTELYNQILTEVQTHDLAPYELLFINDGSIDNSLEILSELKSKDENIRIINFYRNYGKAAALTVGFRLCRGENIITMDADLQDDPKEIQKFIALSEEKKLDMISGWKKIRHDSLEKRLPSKFFNYITSKVGGITLHDFNCGLKFYKRKVVKSIFHLIYGDMHRFIPLLAHWSGFKVGEMVVRHHARKHGISKYGLGRYFHGFIDLLTLSLLSRYKSRPMHVFGGFGTLTLLAGMGINVYFLIEWIMTQSLHIRPIMLLGIILVVVSLQFFSLGFISEIIIQRSSKDKDYNFEEF